MGGTEVVQPFNIFIPISVEVSEWCKTQVSTLVYWAQQTSGEALTFTFVQTYNVKKKISTNLEKNELKILILQEIKEDLSQSAVIKRATTPVSD